MKNLIFIFGIILSSVAFANVNGNQTYLLLEGRNSAMTNINWLVTEQNPTNLPVYTQVNNGIGEYFNYSFVKDGQVVAAERIHFSDAIVSSVGKHLSNPQVGQSLMSVCGRQGGQILNVNRVAQQYSNQPTVITETKVEVVEVEKIIKEQPIVYNNNQIVDLTETNQRLAELQADNAELEKQIRRNRTWTIVMGVGNILATAVDGYVTRDYIKKHSKPNNNYTYNIYNNGGGNNGGGDDDEQWGPNGSGDEPGSGSNNNGNHDNTPGNGSGDENWGGNRGGGFQNGYASFTNSYSSSVKRSANGTSSVRFNKRK